LLTFAGKSLPTERMNTEAIRTFLELSMAGNFSRVAERLHVTQSTVSARIKVLEQDLNCQLFERTSTGVSLTNAGKKFHRYAASMQQLWQQGRLEVGLLEGYDGSVGVGIHMTLWRRFMPAWLIWMRKSFPKLALHVEADYSERLTDYVTQGGLDLAITHMPQVLPGLVVERFLEDRMVMVSREKKRLSSCSSKDYLYIDWSYGYREEHLDKLPEFQNSPFNIGFGEIALEYILQGSGYCYLPLVAIEDHLADRRLHIVEGAPELSRPAYLIYPEFSVDADRTRKAIEGLRSVL
jgi:LysR family transcriptional regulator, flagellar master operon regulator